MILFLIQRNQIHSLFLNHHHKFLGKILGAVAILLLSFTIFIISCSTNQLPNQAPNNLRSEYRSNPLGIDNPRPKLSWKLQSERRGIRQSAYQILVASNLKTLADDNADVWNSRKINSEQSVHIIYSGPLLKSGKRYFWKVRIWDEKGRVSAYSAPAWWEMAFLRQEDWEADWIAAPEEISEGSDIPFGDWIWHPSRNGNDESVYFVRKIDLNADCAINQAKIKITADDGFTLYVNEKKVGNGEQWRDIFVYDVTSLLTGENNIIAIKAFNKSRSSGLVFGMNVVYQNGVNKIFTSDENWLCSIKKIVNWQKGKSNDSLWVKAAVVKKYGEADWGYLEYRHPAKSYLFRKEFNLSDKTEKARIYVSGLGLYELYINGNLVGDDKLRPGWTRFPNRVQYQIYDVTKFLKKGANAIGLMLGNGWWSSVMGGNWRNSQPRLICQLKISQLNGSNTQIVSDKTWKVTQSPILENSLFNGETYDARLEILGWAFAGLNDSLWQNVKLANDKNTAHLTAQQAPPMRITAQLKPRSVSQPLPGKYVYDFGQNHAGRLRIKVRGKSGARVQIRHSEILNPDGTLNTDNYRMARATDVYYLKGGEEEIYEPHFTYRGFRYAEISGLTEKLPLENVISQVIHNDVERTGFFKCSNPLINKIYENILWGQRSNLYSVPTDCPQRNERLGWTGDAQAFSATACWNMDMELFFKKWMRDIMDSQTAEGIIQNINPTLENKWSSPGWGDAAVIIPWNVYRFYGDKRVILENYSGMKKWIDYMQSRAKDGVLYDVAGYGDWLSVKPSPYKPIGAAYYYYSTQLFSAMAGIIGQKDDEQKYAELADKISTAFNNTYFDENGYYPGKTQTSYVLPLAFGLVAEVQKERVLKNLVKNIVAQNYHLSTGFMGTAHMFKILSDNGFHDTAYRMVAQRTYPSWGYEIENGATTIWEHWNSNRLDEVDASMNSFNHFALGSVGSWLYESLVGINPNPQVPGFKRIIFRPRPVGDLTWAEATYKSMYGDVYLRWEKDADKFSCKITVPPNTTALVYLPIIPNLSVIRENGKICFENDKSKENIEGIRCMGKKNGSIVFELVSGKYIFEMTGQNKI